VLSSFLSVGQASHRGLKKGRLLLAVVGHAEAWDGRGQSVSR